MPWAGYMFPITMKVLVKMRDSQGSLILLLLGESLQNSILGSMRWQREEDPRQKAIEGYIKACQGCEGSYGTFHTDCEFPAFNVFHSEPIFRPNIYISNSSSFSGSYTPLRIKLFSHKMKVTATPVSKTELLWVLPLVSFVLKFPMREMRITVFPYLTETL